MVAAGNSRMGTLRPAGQRLSGIECAEAGDTTTTHNYRNGT
jgi:hypothetical protein